LFSDEVILLVLIMNRHHLPAGVRGVEGEKL